MSQSFNATHLEFIKTVSRKKKKRTANSLYQDKPYINTASQRAMLGGGDRDTLQEFFLWPLNKWNVWGARPLQDTRKRMQAEISWRCLLDISVDPQVHSCQRWNYRLNSETVRDRSSEMAFLQSGFAGFAPESYRTNQWEDLGKLACLVFFPSLIQKRIIFFVVRY